MQFDLTIDKNEVLRYLMYKNDIVDPSLNSIIDKLIAETKDISRPRFTYHIFSLRKEKDLLLEGTTLFLKGNDIKKHLEFSNKCIVMCATLGSEIEMRINYYSKIELLKSIILDACASTYIEALCDMAELRIKENEISNIKGLFFTSRYSPGYGDFDISVQKDLLNIIDAPKKIGVTVTDSSIMLPRKSVSAIIGLQDIKTEENKDKCSLCSLNGNCNFRKENIYCGTKK